MIEPSMRERIARAICKRRFGSTGKYMWQDWLGETDAVLAELEKLTEAMVEKGGDADINDGEYRAGPKAALECWQLMITEARKP